MNVMKINSQKREGNNVLLEVEVEVSEFKVAVDKTIVRASKEINIPGFRPGKAPREMVERTLDREALEARAASDLISELYPRVIEESKIEPVDYPGVDIVQQKKAMPFVFSVKVDVYPEVKLGKYMGLKVDKTEAAITENEIDKILESLQKRFAGKEALPPLDDEFAKKVSHFQTLDELKKEVREGLLKDKTKHAEADVKDKLVATAVAEAKVDIPKGMIEREVDVLLDELKSSLAQSGLSLGDYLKGIKKDEKTIRAELQKSAEMRVRGKVVLRAVALEEKIKISEEELEREVKNMAAATGENMDELNKRLDEGAKRYIGDYMLRRKALDLIVGNAKINITKEEKK
ncbi:hypothetical protein A3H38_06325 [candidate division WOR-1 bacterium RIFCSPLOWO2_02_FULL_46_20]|uniref:Trigger factor n=1 Tax=candidate division WOR-1 bacterium RIFCSPLOWO2_02_FULL_46_20 TaxID=1802567 RepID=A0A1F4R3Y5_UNCSA|nr:MAG: hypothetical protein A3H38_06325 [candidate division WOR-1 bacterium RIFCSPLOWO2_02_FULL_46_20]